jgi:hypothetical protein
MIESDCYECGLNETCTYGDGFCITFDSFRIDVDMEQDPIYIEVVPVVEHIFIPLDDGVEQVGFA